MINQQNDTFIILTPGFASSEADTNCLPMQQGLIRTLREEYPNLNIILLAFQYPYFKRTYQWQGATVISFNGKNKGGLSRIIREREIMAVLKKLHRTNKLIGLLSFWMAECAGVGNRFAKENGLKHYCWILGQDARVSNKYIKYMKAESDEMVALSDFLQDEFERNHGVRPAYMIPSGTDIKRLPPPAAKRDIDILGAGSLIALKRFDRFVEIIAAIKKQVPAVTAQLVGEGPEKEKILALIARHQLQDTIILTGEIPHPELLKLMQRAKILLHPSLYEGFSGVCQEALACGAQVISFCRAMKQEIDQWHIVNNDQEMIAVTVSLMQESSFANHPVIPFPMTDVAGKMMELFGR